MRARIIIPAIAALAVAAAGGVLNAPASAAAAIESGRFVWHDLMTRDVQAARRFYGDLLGWRFEDVTRGDRAYVLARAGSDPVAGIVDINRYPDAGSQWISFMAVDDVDKAVGVVQAAGGSVLLDPRELEPVARVAVVADPQGAPLGLAKLRKDRPEITKPVARQFFWDEYLAGDAAQALDFYKRLAGYQSAISDTRLGVEYHVLQNSRKRARPVPAAGVGHWHSSQLAALHPGRRSAGGGVARQRSWWPRDSSRGPRTAERHPGDHQGSIGSAGRPAEVSLLSALWP